ncbi:MAG: hypothetical protein HKN93_06995 [Acidimicrobiia bacterium]|nr:hypothetical protein [Acidimicrobiia bacterium]
MRKLWRLAIVLVLLLSACEMQANFIFDFEEDGTGEFNFEMGFDEEMEQLLALGSDGEFEFNTLAEQFNADVPGGQVEEFERDGLRFFGASVPFTDAPSLEAEVFGPDSPFETFDFSIDGDIVTLNADVDTSEAFDTGEIPADQVPEGFDLDEVFGIHFQVGMPGEVTSHNADRVLSNGLLEWDLPLVSGAPLTLQATSDLSGGGFPWTMILIIGLLIIAALVVAIVLATRRNQSVEALAATGESAPPSSWLDTGAPEPTDSGAVVSETVTPEPSTAAAEPVAMVAEEAETAAAQVTDDLVEAADAPTDEVSQAAGEAADELTDDEPEFPPA